MSQQAKPTRVLFVCTGNICRSPTAEGVFRHLVRAEGLEDRIHVDSAGTHDYHLGDPPDPRSVAAALRRGYDLAELRARQLAAKDFSAFDLLLAMDSGHLRIMRRLAPATAAERLRLFLDYAPRTGLRDVPDPYYGEARDFETTLALIELGARGLLDAIRAAQR